MTQWSWKVFIWGVFPKKQYLFKVKEDSYSIMSCIHNIMLFVFLTPIFQLDHSLRLMGNPFNSISLEQSCLIQNHQLNLKNTPFSSLLSSHSLSLLKYVTSMMCYHGHLDWSFVLLGTVLKIFINCFINRFDVLSLTTGSLTFSCKAFHNFVYWPLIIALVWCMF